jgi:hypothetical protein
MCETWSHVEQRRSGMCIQMLVSLGSDELALVKPWRNRSNESTVHVSIIMDIEDPTIRAMLCFDHD